MLVGPQKAGGGGVNHHGVGLRDLGTQDFVTNSVCPVKMFEFYERVSGARMHAAYVRPGGVHQVSRKLPASRSSPCLCPPWPLGGSTSDGSVNPVLPRQSWLSLAEPLYSLLIL